MASTHDDLTPPQPAGEDTFTASGLREEVEILIDDWGVPHIYAASALDAYTAQGFQAARDRLFQIDLWRRRGLGKLSEVFGAAHLDQDRATRLFLYRGDMRTEWLSYGTQARDVVTAFVNGVNAYIDWALEDPGRLPPEFASLGYRPDRWQPEDVVRIRTHGLLYNAEQELARALTLRDLGSSAEKLRAVREPASTSAAAEAEVRDYLADTVLDVYRLAFAPVDFGAKTSSETSTPSGSNNWVISPTRTATGRPILANDPHRAVTLPSLRYLSHLEAPGLSVIGAGEPNLPGISIGHNKRLGFGLTIWPVDHEDLYVYELYPDDDSRYLYHGAWESMRVIEERVQVADGGEAVHTLSFTRHGPVVAIDAEHRRAVAVRAVWLEPGMAPYLGSLEYQNAEDAKSFRKALRRWGAPGVNMVFASVDGDIGWQASALVPRRPNWDGSHPVPGDGRYEWDGFAELEELPSATNPDSGWVTTSNECNLPPDYDNDALTTTTDWYTSGRHERLTHWLTEDASVDIETSIAMQSDAMNVHGRLLLDQLSWVKPHQHVWDWAKLQAWDGMESADSFEALVYQVWQRRHLRPWLVDHALTRLGLDDEAITRARHRLLRADTLFSDIRPDMRMIEVFDTADPGDRERLTLGVETTLSSALTEIEKLLGPDRTTWQWGNLHQTTLRHSVFSRQDLPGSDQMPPEWAEVPGVPRPGSGDTVGLTGYDAEFNAVMGSSFRMALDIGEWDSSRVLNSPGQSGDPRSDHYTDLFDLWAQGDSFPLLYSRTSIEERVRARIVLRPEYAHPCPPAIRSD
ncbi:penicillin acylase family protein [Rothia sp. AR01]|uniref:Penicillin acylase family protein n=1 Tax=Rothia santali TaxID=2949643 RepID=A0A9X2HGC8_9MICC|nr:penicillin acylase family protein [Rothia santali]MCP3425221.1 penicillin acylase family protein [Rothia santali]